MIGSLRGVQLKIRAARSSGKAREVLRTGGVELLVVEGESGKDILIPMAQIESLLKLMSRSRRY